MEAQIAPRVTVQVRVVRHVTEQVNIVLNVVEMAYAPTNALEANAKIVSDPENKIVPYAMVMVHALFAGETTNFFQIVLGVTAQTSVNIVVAKEKKNVWNALMVIARYAREPTNAGNAMDSLFVVLVEVMATVQIA